MNYIDTYVELNPHLTQNTATEVKSTTTPIYTVQRNPPRFLRYSMETTITLQRIFKFSDALFEPHSVSFPKHIIETITRPSASLLPTNAPSIHCYTKWGNGYYHFMTEVLPNILFCMKTNPTGKVYCLPSSFAKGVIDFFKVPNPILYTMPPTNESMVRQPYIECGNPSPEKIQILRSAIQECVEPKVQAQAQLGIVIFRKEAVRTVTNHDALVKMLEEVYPSLQWVTFNTASPADTANLFSRAAIIVAPHGAGLTNMIFAPSGIPIYEFLPLENPNVCYWHLSEMMGNIYHGIPCKTVMRGFTLDIEGIKPLFAPLKN